MNKKIVNILGTSYKLEYRDINDDDTLKEMEGYTDLYQKLIVIGNMEQREYFNNAPKEKIEEIKNKVLRHEIIHAFLFESGLDANSNRTISWAENEEMVDWFAIQSPKIFKVYKDLGLLNKGEDK